MSNIYQNASECGHKVKAWKGCGLCPGHDQNNLRIRTLELYPCFCNQHFCLKIDADLQNRNYTEGGNEHFLLINIVHFPLNQLFQSLR